MTRPHKNRIQQAGLICLVLGLVFLLIAVAGLFWCYFAGLQSTDLLPEPITAAILGAGVYLAAALGLLVAGQGSGGGPREGRRNPQRHQPSSYLASEAKS